MLVALRPYRARQLVCSEAHFQQCALPGMTKSAAQIKSHKHLSAAGCTRLKRQQLSHQHALGIGPVVELRIGGGIVGLPSRGDHRRDGREQCCVRHWQDGQRCVQVQQASHLQPDMTQSFSALHWDWLARNACTIRAGRWACSLHI